jgi:hypothetical protein
VTRQHRIQVAGFELEIRDEPAYSPGSADKPRTYAHEYLLCSESVITSRHGIVCRRGEVVGGSAVLLAGGGGSGVHEHSIAVLDNRAYVAVGDYVVCLELPALTLVWNTKADSATVFGVHLSRANDGILVHGELDITRLTLDGKTVWSVSGADIFTGDFSVDDERVRAHDFEGRAYVFDVRTGRHESA